MKQFPDINEIKLLEKNSQRNGSGIVYEELLGIWKFKYVWGCLLYTSPSPRDLAQSRMPSSA